VDPSPPTAQSQEPKLRRELSRRQIILRRNAEGIGDAIEEGEHRGDVDGFRDLILFPSGVAQFLDVIRGGTAGGFGDELHVIEQNPLGRSQSGFIELTFENCAYALIAGSLDPQEVGMTVQSIWTAVEVGDVAGNHLLMTTGQVSFGEMHRV
jgi:hypothetical protein